MIVTYIGETRPLELTHGKEYDVLSVEKGWYRIIDDTGEDYLYPPEYFKERHDRHPDNMIPCRVEYISDPKSIFFIKGQIYDAFLPQCDGGKGMIAFWFGEDEMDEAGYYARPLNRFRLIDGDKQNPEGDFDAAQK